LPSLRTRSECRRAGVDHRTSWAVTVPFARNAGFQRREPLERCVGAWIDRRVRRSRPLRARRRSDPPRQPLTTVASTRAANASWSSRRVVFASGQRSQPSTTISLGGNTSRSYLSINKYYVVGVERERCGRDCSPGGDGRRRTGENGAEAIRQSRANDQEPRSRSRSQQRWAVDAGGSLRRQSLVAVGGVVRDEHHAPTIDSRGSRREGRRFARTAPSPPELVRDQRRRGAFGSRKTEKARGTLGIGHSERSSQATFAGEREVDQSVMCHRADITCREKEAPSRRRTAGRRLGARYRAS